jgi:hypothetical protein
MISRDPQPELFQRFMKELDREFATLHLERVADQVWVEETPTGPSAMRAAVTWSDTTAGSTPSFRIIPFAGVTVLPVEQLLARTWPEPREPFAPAVQCELGTLFDPPELLDFTVVASQERSVAAAIAARLDRHAIPWIESLRDPAELIAAIRKSGLRREVLLPAALAVLDQSENAVAELDAELAKLEVMGERSAPGWPSWLTLYRQFSDSLRAEIRVA